MLEFDALLERALEADRALAGVGHGARQALAVTGRLDGECDDVLADAVAEHEDSPVLPGSRAPAPLVLNLVVVAALEAALEADRPLVRVGHGAGQGLATI